MEKKNTTILLQKRILRRLTDAGKIGMNRGQLYRSLSRPLTRLDLDVALRSLRNRGLARTQMIMSGHRGRPAEMWWAIAKKDNG